MRCVRENHFDVLYPEQDSERALTEFMRTLGETLLAGDNPRWLVARQQFASARVDSTALTGCGFFVNLALSAGAIPGDPAVICSGLSNAVIEGPGITAGAVLLAREGLITSIEGFTCGDDPWSMESALRYLRDLEPGARISRS